MDASFIFVPGNFPLICCEFQASDGQNRKSLKNPKLSRILKNKPWQAFKLMNTFLETENEYRLGFELWPHFARFFCAIALKYKTDSTSLDLLELIRVAFGVWVPDRASIAEDGSHKAEVSSGLDFR